MEPVKAEGAPSASTAVSSGRFAPEPFVQLVNAFRDPLNNAVATARTCYSPRVIYPEDVGRDEKTRAQRDAIADSTYKAGHHTTLQHATFQFVLDNVSRQCIWSFLHSHPFYNSEQVSQRYVTVSPDRVAVPPLEGKALELYRETVDMLMAAYARLIELLNPAVIAEYKRLFPLRDPGEKKWARYIQRKSQEIARYVLPVATHAHLYHTISALTLHRYHRLCLSMDTPLEQKIIVEKMVAEVRKIDPEFVDRMEDPIPLEDTPERQALRRFHRGAREFLREFDAELEGKTSKLVDYKVNGEAVLAQAVRSILGLPKARMTDDQAIALVMSPAQNLYLSESLNLAAHAKLTRAMVHMNFTFKKKISHTADSQDQRHRMTPGSRPALSGHFVPEKPDYIVPALIWETPGAFDFYEETMQALWDNIAALLNMGTPEEFALYLLPNAVSVRFEESGDLLNFHHKWSKRLCYTAQEEIWKTSQEELLQVAEIAPRVAAHIGAPCALRAAAPTRPFCPEGDRFCGVLVWRMPVAEYQRLI
jgi:flavin-dependent thymidylate synthase